MKSFFRYVAYANNLRKNLYRYYCFLYNSKLNFSKTYFKTYFRLFRIYLIHGLFTNQFSIKLSYCAEIELSGVKIDTKIPEPFEDSLIYILNENGFVICSKFVTPLSAQYIFTYSYLGENNR